MRFLFFVLLGGLLLTCQAQESFSQADDLQPAMHTLVGSYIFSSPEGPRWEAQKKTLAGYTPEQLVRALIAEIDVDRGSPLENRRRNYAAYVLFHALDLPPALVIQELDKPDQPPERKVSLVIMLRHANMPEVVQALLRQLGDYRQATTPQTWSIEIGYAKHRDFRVRDEAFNALMDNFDDPDPPHIQTYNGNKTREKMIQNNLARLKLTPP